ncbi:hypothetical protein EDB89DRAFT_838374 [Lactarius sanguifluus]|nr:hypothetical protein EDB89DRAFT_838374 [Lactarius sanguifluus]
MKSLFAALFSPPPMASFPPLLYTTTGICPSHLTSVLVTVRLRMTKLSLTYRGCRGRRKKRLEVLEVMAQIDLLEARWKVADGIAELSQKVCRRLVKQYWQNESALDLLIRCFTSPFSW